jgi:hypothetical protein
MIKYWHMNTKDFIMTEFKKPIFTKDELDPQKTGIDVGYDMASLIPGHDFSNKPFATKTAKAFTVAKERLNGTAKKRGYHETINSFGWARIYENELMFGIKYSSHSSKGPSRLGQSAIKKYKQLLGYCLAQAGWRGIKTDGDGNYTVPLNNPENLKLFYTLSPSIGFYYKAPVPDMDYLEQLECEIKYNNMQKSNSGR